MASYNTKVYIVREQDSVAFKQKTHDTFRENNLKYKGISKGLCQLIILGLSLKNIPSFKIENKCCFCIM